MGPSLVPLPPSLLLATVAGIGASQEISILVKTIEKRQSLKNSANFKTSKVSKMTVVPASVSGVPDTEAYFPRQQNFAETLKMTSLDLRLAHLNKSSFSTKSSQTQCDLFHRSIMACTGMSAF